MIFTKLYNHLKNKYEVQIADIINGIKYLRKYGYISDDINDSSLDIKDVVSAVIYFQGLANLNPDGEMGTKTLRAMNWPRCQMPDMDNGKPFEYAKISGKWGIKNLKYYLSSYNDLSKEEWRQAFRAAFDSWSEVCDLHFEEVDSSSKANIVIGVGRGRRYNFDGSGGTLAWMYLVPRYGYTGQVSGMMDADETWLKKGDSGRGIYLQPVAAHEIGHALNLYHSNVRSALMAPFYSPRVWVPQQNDDITRIQASYGKPKTSPKPEPPKPEPPTPEPKPPTPEPPTPEPSPETLTIKVDGNIRNIEIPGYRIHKMS